MVLGIFIKDKFPQREKAPPSIVSTPSGISMAVRLLQPAKPPTLFRLFDSVTEVRPVQPEKESLIEVTLLGITTENNAVQ